MLTRKLITAIITTAIVSIFLALYDMLPFTNHLEYHMGSEWLGWTFLYVRKV